MTLPGPEKATSIAQRRGWVTGFALVASTALFVGNSTAQTPSINPVAARPLQQYSVADTPIRILLADPAASEILRRYVPSFADSSRTKMLGDSSLKDIQGYALAVLSDAVLAQIDAELVKLPPVDLPPRTTTIDEAKVRPYTLPDPLVLANGTRITRPSEWWQTRRPQIVSMFETLEFGRAPARPRSQRFEVFERGARALADKAIRRQVLIHLGNDAAAPTIQLVEYLPAAARGPVPMVLMIGFTAPSAMIDDPGIRPSQVWDVAKKQRVAATPGPGGKFDPKPFLDAGFGVTTYYYGDVDPDYAEGYAQGIRGYLAGGAPRTADAWGAVAAWAWSLSRVQDYLETDRGVDSKRVALIGASRLGKTVLWAAAHDQRFAAVISCCSGKIGASLMRRNFGSPIAGSFPGETDYWMADNFRQFHGNENNLPMDGHMLLGLIAPRPVLLQTGKYDHAADPKGEFLAGVAATPVYRLLGKPGLEATDWPPLGPSVDGQIGFTMNSGGHGMQPGDWGIYLQFLQKHLQHGRH
ncbi:MAG: hypothetical protein ABIM50_10745 [Novosphingobium sp.]